MYIIARIYIMQKKKKRWLKMTQFHSFIWKSKLREVNWFAPVPKANEAPEPCPPVYIPSAYRRDSGHKCEAPARSGIMPWGFPFTSQAMYW